ncbi:N-acetylglucosamine-1-phosphotransferase subunits alpha/beta-like [Nerophis ophidion]|uniref:N-acetylglucosamine-1-phosphotransferase subunits alpha/beta-like n=1 Tax=Nerophis ophidion TaxID=159077 RepID=UPI002AE05834|nr:N-acetylglucosamine-1-phosphotransferase subunits alpha/beta-like [Nerophis ophidion]
MAYLTGFLGSFEGSEELRARLPTAIIDKITALELYQKNNIALLHFKSPQHLNDLLQESRNELTLDGKELAISPVYLFWDIPKREKPKDILTANRFEDNAALRHSLRSVEKYAPWVRHIFIVTNGQIPFWLNLENPQVSVVTHKEIFLNHSHLPTFSSPAIESNLHRIPGLAQKFIYLNDDVMFGKDVWLDDFYTPTNGQKVYLTWPFPPCSRGCSGGFIENGVCNQQCNNVACDWDGGDCKGRAINNDSGKGRSRRSAGIWGTSNGGELPQARTSQVATPNKTLTPEPLLIFLNEDKSGSQVQVSSTTATPVRRNLQAFDSYNKGFLPWEKIKYFKYLPKEDERQPRMQMYETNGAAIARKLQNSFADSLRYVDRLYNRKFGIMSRQTIAHTPHMIDKFVMQELQDTFPKEFEKTSSHHLRDSDDMQFAFSYFYYLMSVKQQVNISEVFDTADKDHSGLLSKSEIEGFARRIFKEPLNPTDLTGLSNELITCSKTPQNEVMQIRQGKSSQEVYSDQNMPQITKDLVLHCKPVTDRIRKAFAGQKKYKYQIMEEEEIHFKLIKNDKDMNILHFKDVRNKPKKFICLNDDIDRNKSGAKEANVMLAEFYKAMFSRPSQFELPLNKTNRFLHMDELQKWEVYQEKLRFYRYCAVVVLIIFGLKIIFKLMTRLKQMRLHRRKELKYKTFQQKANV